MTEWISVEDKLPDKNCYTVMVRWSNGSVEKAWFIHDKMTWLNFYGIKTSYFARPNSNEFYHDVTHWMPIPKLKEDQS